MSFEEIAPPPKYAPVSIEPDEIVISTRSMRKCQMVVLRFGEGAVKRLKLRVGHHYLARWGSAEHQGKLRLSEVSRGWELKQPKRSKIAQITFSRLPASYQGKQFSGKRITAEQIDGVPGRSEPFVQLVLPVDFFAEPDHEQV
ncbi:hypothetical protein [Thalassospira marina]|uniref:Uncharacterized protein n=1 Tax=Thalassospira marina TaxID=2048283 RepID=A0ABN5FI13_9PROT|nr:hypothetical protein [Thalassospira marina]AUG53910.1 hypothetical protein CSC3H3_15195 [Thalassospira marina]